MPDPKVCGRCWGLSRETIGDHWPCKAKGSVKKYVWVDKKPPRKCFHLFEQAIAMSLKKTEEENV